MIFIRKRREKPVFLLGVGAQKAGTSFIYQSLMTSTEVALSHPKELHVFDAYFRPDICGQFSKRKEEKLQRLRRETNITSKRRQKKRLREMKQQARMTYDLSAYVRYFKRLGADARLTGEITPSYSTLYRQHFESIRDLLDSTFDLRIVYLMRDPIDRLYSAMRMDDRDLGRETNLAHDRFVNGFRERKHLERSYYERVIPDLEAVFGNDRVFFGFFETIFSQKEFDRLTDFLNVQRIEPEFGCRVNASPQRGVLSPEAKAEAYRHLQKTYDYCRARFGREFINSIWYTP